MIIYLLLMSIITFIYFLTHRSNDKNDKLFLIISFFILFIFAAIRAESTGYDLPIYKSFYYNVTPLSISEQLKIDYNNFEIGYLIYSKIIYFLSNGNFRVLLVVTSFISYYGVFMFFKTYSNNKLLSVILYICIGYYIAPFSGLRQCIAISIICLSYKYIINRDFKKFILAVIIASLFHKSAIIFLFGYFLYNIKLENKKSIILIFLVPIIFIYRYYLVNVFEHLFYKNYDLLTNSGGGYTLLLFYFFILVLITMFKKKFIDNNPTNNMMYNFLFMGILIQILSTVEGNAHRAGKYYLICLCCLLPNLEKILNKNDKKGRLLIKVLVYTLAIAFFVFAFSGIEYNVFF